MKRFLILLSILFAGVIQGIDHKRVPYRIGLADSIDERRAGSLNTLAHLLVQRAIKNSDGTYTFPYFKLKDAHYSSFNIQANSRLVVIVNFTEIIFFEASPNPMMSHPRMDETQRVNVSAS